MERKYAILRKLPSEDGTREGFPLGVDLAGVDEPEIEIDFQVHTLDQDAAKDQERQDNTLVAPELSLSLIEPASQKEENIAEDALDAWGIEAVGADTSPCTGRGVTVAVLDTGIDQDHPEFEENGNFEMLCEDFTGGGNHVDANGHGTHCAGTIFGHGSDKRIGVAPEVSKALIGKVIDDKGNGSSEALYEALNWALKEKAHVISMSLGFNYASHVAKLVNQWDLPPDIAAARALEDYRKNLLFIEALADLVQRYNQTTIIIAASGNESRVNDDPSYTVGVTPPAAATNIISVGAISRLRRVAHFSNRNVTVCSPGVDIHSAKPGAQYKSSDGTSMATPHVAGVAALWVEKLMKDGHLTSKNLEANLLASCSVTGLEQPGQTRYDYGSGIPQAPQ